MKASALPARVLSSRLSPTPTHGVQREKRVGAERGHPSGWRECAPGVAAAGARRAGAGATGPAEAAACVVLFLDSFQLLGKKTFVSRYKKGGGWGEKESRVERLFGKVD